MARYGLEKVKAGFYLHPPSGFHLLRTDGWEGSRGGTYFRWEIAEVEPSGGTCVPCIGLPAATLREAVREAEIAFKEGKRPSSAPTDSNQGEDERHG